MLTLFPLKLYSTSHCHLCEEAEALISELKLAHQLTLIDIADNEALLTAYAIRIPVLKRTDNQIELDWPFNRGDLLKFLAQ